MGVHLEAVQWRTRAVRQGERASRVTRSYLAKHYRRAFVIGGEGVSVPALRVCNGLEAQGSDLQYDGLLTWSEHSLQMVDRLARILAFRRRSWAVSALGTHGRQARNFSRGSAARARRLLAPAAAAAAAQVEAGAAAARAAAAAAAAAVEAATSGAEGAVVAAARAGEAAAAARAGVAAAAANSTEVFASVAVFQGDVVAASLRASKRVDGDAVRWRWPALASEAAAAECEAAVREAFLALDVRNGVFGAILRTHGGGGGGGGGCALVTALPRPHRWPLLGDEGMQLFFQPDLWLEEVAALMLANGESPAPAMRLRTAHPLVLEARCDRRGGGGQLAEQLLYAEWLVRLSALGTCELKISPSPSWMGPRSSVPVLT